MSNQKVWISVADGYRLPAPEGLAGTICTLNSHQPHLIVSGLDSKYKLMMVCWATETKERPTFTQLVHCYGEDGLVSSNFASVVHERVRRDALQDPNPYRLASNTPQPGKDDDGDEDTRNRVHTLGWDRADVGEQLRMQALADVKQHAAASDLLANQAAHGEDDDDTKYVEMKYTKTGRSCSQTRVAASMPLDAGMDTSPDYMVKPEPVLAGNSRPLANPAASFGDNPYDHISAIKSTAVPLDNVWYGDNLYGDSRPPPLYTDDLAARRGSTSSSVAPSFFPSLADRYEGEATDNPLYVSRATSRATILAVDDDFASTTEF